MLFQWMRTTLLHNRAVKLSKSKVHVLSDSVLRLDKIHEHPRSMEAGKDKIESFMKSLEHRELDRTDGKPIVFKCKNFPGHTTLQLLWENPKSGGGEQNPA